MTRVRAFITGIVQGVGFRPFIYNLARRYDLRGWVLNSTDGVHLEVEGPQPAVQAFLEAIRPEAPPLARIDAIQVESLPAAGYDAFVIRHSEGDANQYVKISPDVCICADCLRELRDPTDRRYHYPFINCTNCGPRYTIIEDIPYDRPNTTMKVFPMCPACQREYEDPTNRRFHAQPNACPVCGPHLWLEWDGETIREDALPRALALLREGHILAIKGLGGFHLACDATNGTAVQRLRERKRRVMKPFAIMSATLDQVRRYCYVNPAEAELLQSIQRPIVLLDQRPDNPIAPSVAPNNRTLGVMLPYTPLHYLLFDETFGEVPLALVMTSANLSEEPIVIDNEEARRRLASLADGFLMHNRDICTRCDDSVARVIELPGEESPFHPFLIRRSRGYAPEPVDLAISLPPILACGGELKNTIALTRENHVFLSQHIGDLENAEAYQYFLDTIAYIARLFRISPEIVAYDRHPEYLATKYALEQQDKEQIGVQHHHAHIAACLAEHDVREPVLGVALDGTGYGLDGAIWGGEFLRVDGATFRRLAHLRYVPLPGGDAAVKQVWRMGLAYLHDAFGEALWELDLPFVSTLDPFRADVILQMIRRGVNAPLTSSAGRLFDAVSAILGVCAQASYEAQAAIELEMLADPGASARYPWAWGGPSASGEGREIDLRPLIRGIVQDVLAGVPREEIAGAFHRSLARMIAEVAEQLGREQGLTTVALGGGVFQNRRLLQMLWQELGARGLRPLLPRRVPVNDGGLCLGQVWVAALKVERD